ncbi:MAG TPA: glycoside hydrolase family 20 zincin-like fold domain-containing protein, partial [Nitrospiraceae bacterium]|nr:glycoside hydrolase family 20 zincin-like fold domain-containing protein [Nitrospiraceae bacterium]
MGLQIGSRASLRFLFTGTRPIIGTWFPSPKSPQSLFPMKTIVFALMLCLAAGSAMAQNVALLFEHSVPQAAYAARKLGETLAAQGYRVTQQRSNYDYLISLAEHPEGLSAESFAIVREGKVITIKGGDHRGLIYGALAVAESLRNGTRLETIPASSEKPKLEFRGIKYNLPWDTYRPSSALDQHRDTARDLKYWEAFLDMMVENRFNAISLWNMHPFTYMVQPKNFPEASPWSKQEFAQWQHLYREIFRMAKERGLDTYIVFWSIFVSKEFAQAHDVAKENFYPHYYVQGDTSEIVRRDLRESVKQVLQEYPDLDGIGVSHGEGMAGMTPLQRQEWIDDVLIA